MSSTGRRLFFITQRDPKPDFLLHPQFTLRPFSVVRRYVSTKLEVYFYGLTISRKSEARNGQTNGQGATINVAS